MSWPGFYTRWLGINLITSSGTNTSFAANKLIDSGATFETDNIQVGDHVKNTFDATSATVTAVDSQTQLALSADIFPTAVLDTYEVGNYNWGITAAQPADDGFDAHGILIGSGGTAGISDVKLTPKKANNAEVLKLSNGVIHQLSIDIVHFDVTDGADIVILGNND